MVSSKRIPWQLGRVLTRGRYRPIVLWLRDGSRLRVVADDALRLQRERGTIELTTNAGLREIHIAEVLAVELPQREPRPE